MVYCLYPLYGKRSVVFNAGFQRLEQYLTLTILNLYWRLVSAIHTQMFSPERLEKGEQVRIMEVRLMVSKKKRTIHHEACSVLLFCSSSFFNIWQVSVMDACLEDTTLLSSGPFSMLQAANWWWFTVVSCSMHRWADVSLLSLHQALFPNQEWTGHLLCACLHSLLCKRRTTVLYLNEDHKVKT